MEMKLPNKKKSREIIIVDEGGAFSTFFKKFTSKNIGYDFEGLSALRRILSNEKARLMDTIKRRNPGSIYELSRILQRDFKSVSDDVKLLERFGIVEMVSEKTGKRNRLKPVLSIDTLNITIRI